MAREPACAYLELKALSTAVGFQISNCILDHREERPIVSFRSIWSQLQSQLLRAYYHIKCLQIQVEIWIQAKHRQKLEVLMVFQKTQFIQQTNKMLVNVRV